MTSGVSVRLTSVATRSPTARPSGDSGPTSSTVPTSIPPDPVSGFCILPRVATMSSTSARTASPCFSPYWVCLRSSWRNDAASRLSRSTRMRTSSGHRSARVSRRRAAWGSTAPSSSTRCRPVGSLVRTSAWMSEEVFMQSILLGLARRTANLAAWHWTRRMFSTYSPRCVAAHTTGAPSDLTPAARRSGATRGEPMSIETATSLEGALATGQPYPYQRVELVEPDWTRFPGWSDVTAADWASVQWQRAHCIKNVKQLRELMGDLLDERFYADLERDQAERATMSMLVPPQMMNTMVPTSVPHGPGSLRRRSTPTRSGTT